MKKITHYISILAALALVLTGCSYGPTNSNNMEALKSMTLTYAPEMPDIVLPEGFDDSIDSSVNKYFSIDSNKGLIAEIVPTEYIFYYIFDKDEDAGRMLLHGYAECRCSVKKTSQKYNLLNYSPEEIYIRQKIFLDPINEEAAIEMLKSIGACKNETIIEGTYRVPSKFINETDYKLVVKDSSPMLLGDKPYYAFISFYDDIAYLRMLSDGSNETKGDVPAEIASSIDGFNDFLKIYDPDLLGQEN